jgi:GxxExxY protein
VTFEGEPLGAPYKLDFLCFGSVAVELKAAAELHPRHMAQLLHYLRLSGQEIGLLLNFGAPSLGYRRLILSPEWKGYASTEPRHPPNL